MRWLILIGGIEEQSVRSIAQDGRQCLQFTIFGHLLRPDRRLYGSNLLGQFIAQIPFTEAPCELLFIDTELIQDLMEKRRTDLASPVYRNRHATRGPGAAAVRGCLTVLP
jgi:hypothetical protein